MQRGKCRYEGLEGQGRIVFLGEGNLFTRMKKVLLFSAHIFPNALYQASGEGGIITRDIIIEV